LETYFTPLTMHTHKKKKDFAYSLSTSGDIQAFWLKRGKEEQIDIEKSKCMN
jgi:hypothetical protein